MTSCGGADLKSIVEKAKTEGANWSVDDWKAQFKNCVEAAKPMINELKDLQEKVKKDPSKAAEIMKDAQDLEKKYGEMANLMEEFGNIANGCENGKKVMEDEAFLKDVMKEFGLDGLDL